MRTWRQRLLDRGAGLLGQLCLVPFLVALLAAYLAWSLLERLEGGRKR